jgi:hypothetical protein
MGAEQELSIKILYRKLYTMGLYVYLPGGIVKT